MSAAQWDGLPENPERDGWHWVKDFDENTAPWRWCAPDEFDPYGCWIKDASEDVPISRAGRDCDYLGPCLTPAEVAALVEQERREEREAAAAICDAWEAENFRLATDTILLDPLLNGDASCAAANKSAALQLEGAGHAYAAHAAKHIAAAIRARAAT